MIYFVEAEGVGLIKIGVTGCLAERMRTLRAMSPVPLRCLGVMDGGIAEEEDIHGTFSHLCSHDEWFRPSPELMRFIADNGRPPGDEGPRRGRKRRRCPAQTTLYCPAGFADWLTGFADWQGLNVTALIDVAAIRWAKRYGFCLPPALPTEILTRPRVRPARGVGQIMVLATVEWRRWFNDMADRTGRDVNKVMRASLKLYAEQLGYPSPPSGVASIIHP